MPHFIYQSGGRGPGGPERLSEQEIVSRSSHESIQEDGKSLVALGIEKVSKANSAHHAAFHASMATKTFVIEVEDDLGPPCTHKGFKNKYKGEKAIF